MVRVSDDGAGYEQRKATATKVVREKGCRRLPVQAEFGHRASVIALCVRPSRRCQPTRRESCRSDERHGLAAMVQPAQTRQLVAGTAAASTAASIICPGVDVCGVGGRVVRIR